MVATEIQALGREQPQKNLAGRGGKGAPFQWKGRESIAQLSQWVASHLSVCAQSSSGMNLDTSDFEQQPQGNSTPMETFSHNFTKESLPKCGGPGLTEYEGTPGHHKPRSRASESLLSGPALG